MPTQKRGVVPRGVSFAAPLGDIVPSALVDEEAEAVKQKVQKERREENETTSGHDKRENVEPQVVFGDGNSFSRGNFEACSFCYSSS